MAAMFGDEGFTSARTYGDKIMRTWNVMGKKEAPTSYKHGAKEIAADQLNLKFYDIDGNEISSPTWSEGKVAFATGEIAVAEGSSVIKINPDTFPGTFEQRKERHAGNKMAKNLVNCWKS